MFVFERTTETILDSNVIAKHWLKGTHHIISFSYDDVWVTVHDVTAGGKQGSVWKRRWCSTTTAFRCFLLLMLSHQINENKVLFLFSNKSNCRWLSTAIVESFLKGSFKKVYCSRTRNLLGTGTMIFPDSCQVEDRWSIFLECERSSVYEVRWQQSWVSNTRATTKLRLNSTDDSQADGMDISWCVSNSCHCQNLFVEIKRHKTWHLL